jgi:hypothetical protein
MSAPKPPVIVSSAFTALLGGAGWSVIVAGLGLVVVLALRLAVVALNRSLSSDVLYPHLFAADALAGTYPLTGWSFGGATFFFPDYLFYLPLLSATGPGGASFAAYAALYFLLLAGLVAAVARWWAGCRPGTAWLAGVFTVNTALALQFLPQHATVLWWLPLPGYHGGTLLNGLALIALTGRLLSGPPPSRVVWLVTGLVLWLGLAANTLLLVQFAGPLFVAVWWLGRCGVAPTGLVRRFVLLGAAALAGVLLLRLGLALADWGYYYPLRFRHTPTPGVLWHAATKFLRDVASDLVPHAWGWGAGLIAWLALLVAAVRRRQQPTADARALALHLLVALSVGAMVDVLVLSGWWKNWYNGRYLLNVLLLPLVTVAIAVARSVVAARLLHGSRAWMLVLGLATAASGVIWAINPVHWQFQKTPQSRELEAIVSRHGLHRGLAGYWQSNLLNTLVDLRGSPRLGQLKADAHPYFWCNNAFWYFEPPTPDGTLRWPVYDFILTAELDRNAVWARFGAPAEIVQEGGWEVFIYDAAGQARIQAVLAPEVVEQLGPSRLRGLRPEF